MEIPEGQVLVSSAELARVAGKNAHLLRQVTELQQHCSLKEEQLRAYRRLEYSKQQLAQLKQDLEETTTRVLKSYGMELSHEIPLPRMTSSGIAV